MKLDHCAAHFLGKVSVNSFALPFAVAGRLSGTVENPHIVDVGSYRGSFAREALNRFGAREFTLHCFDAFPGNIETAREAVSDPRVTFVNAAVTAEDQDAVTFAIPRRSFAVDGRNTWGGRVATDPAAPRFADDEKLSVRGVSLDSYFASLAVSSPLMVKMDIQGGEYDALMGMRRTLPKTSLLYIECQLRNGRDLRYIRFLEKAGFAVVMDSFQFRMKPELSRADAEAICKVLNLRITRFEPQGEIHAVAREGAQIPDALSSKSPFSSFFNYFQTDLLAVNTRQPAAMSAFFETLLSR